MLYQESLRSVNWHKQNESEEEKNDLVWAIINTILMLPFLIIIFILSGIKKLIWKN
jgi:ABC-type methionine transport system permease subunit